MLARLLVIVLTLVGVIPVRICTCGAHNPFDSAIVIAPEAGCDQAAEPAVTESTPTEHHDDDCHFVKPRPLMPVGVGLDVAVPPPDDSITVALLQPEVIAPRVGYAVRDFHPPPTHPLFITLLVLRN